MPRRGPLAPQVVFTGGSIDEVMISSILSRQYISDDLGNFSRKEGRAYVCGRRWRGGGRGWSGRGSDFEGTKDTE